jgi:hypothetical protein
MTNSNRREFLTGTVLALMSQIIFRQHGHPEPRKNITGAEVVRPANVPNEYRKVYAAVASNPSLFDGIRCPCGCHGVDGSLLTCFTGTEPLDCGMCVRAAEAALEALEKGGGLREARAAVDRRFGPP